MSCQLCRMRSAYSKLARLVFKMVRSHARDIRSSDILRSMVQNLMKFFSDSTRFLPEIPNAFLTVSYVPDESKSLARSLAFDRVSMPWDAHDTAILSM